MKNTLTAIKTGDLSTIRERIETKELHKVYLPNGVTALHLAIMYQQLPIVKMLVEAGADINAVVGVDARHFFGIDYKSTPAHLAAMCESTDFMQLLINADAEINLIDNKGNNPLMVAMQHHKDLVVEVILQYNIIPYQDKEMLMKLLVKAVNTDNVVVATVILENSDIDLNQKPVDGELLLLQAIEAESGNIVTLLLKHGACANGLSKSSTDNFTPEENPLYRAIKKNNEFIVSTLIDNDADINFYYSVKHSKEVYIKDSKKHGHYETQTTKEGQTLIGIAVKNNQSKIAIKLIEAGVYYNYQWKEHEQPVLIAAKEKKYDILTKMLEYGVDKNLLDEMLGNYYSLRYERDSINLLIAENEQIKVAQNKSILTEFLKYLANNTGNSIAGLSDNSINLIIEYANLPDRLDAALFKNYIYYNPVSKKVDLQPGRLNDKTDVMTSSKSCSMLQSLQNGLNGLVKVMLSFNDNNTEELNNPIGCDSTPYYDYILDF